ncbi:hypothetical protein B0H13DRAFT_1902794 [Mycena leptocephala]|nr:hypothetical protein B0H13DRAFT_1902794 [Mycena leptocephala]
MAHSFFVECKATSNIPDLNTAISLLYCAARSLLPSAPRLQECIDHLVMALLTRFNYTWDGRDVTNALVLQIATLTNGLNEDHLVDTVSTTSMGDLIEIEDCLGINLFGEEPLEPHTIDRATLEKAIQLYHEALTLWPVSHTHRWRWLWELSEVLLMQFHITGDLAQLDEAICHLREVQRLQPNRRFCLLAVLTTRNQRAMVLENLVEVNGLMESAAQSDQEATELFHTGQDFYRVFQQSGDILAIDSAAIKLQAARWQASWGHPLLSSVLIVLSNVLHVQFEQKEILLGDPKDLDKSIALCREALALQSPPHPGRSKSLNNLAATVLIRFGQQGDPMDIDESIALYEEALALQAHPHLKRSISLNNFSAAIWTRFGQRGDPKDMDKAVSLCREALALQDLSHPDRSTFLNNLSFAISGRFQQRGDPKDIDEAVALSSGGDPKGIDESIILYREALTLRAHPHPQRSISLNNLSGAILLRFEQRGDPKDIDESIALYTEALALRAPPHPDRSNALHDLAAAILTRFGQRGDPKDIDESIAHYREALALRVPPILTEAMLCTTLQMLSQRALSSEEIPRTLMSALPSTEKPWHCKFSHILEEAFV